MPTPLARLIPGGDLVETVGLPRLAISGAIRREAPGGAAGEMLAFDPGGRMEWVSDRLLADTGSLLLDFLYPADSYRIDRPVLQVTGPDGALVLAVTVGRVMFKVRRPPHELAIDLYLNEREGSWLRTVLTWERLDEERMYWRVSVNGRVYDRTIVPPFPEGPLSFLIAPETSRLREVAFHDRPLPPVLHPHVNRTASEPVRCRTLITGAEQDALDARGGVVAFVPAGMRTSALLSALRLMGLEFTLADGAGLGAALRRAAVLILPDGDWAGAPVLAGAEHGMLADVAGFVRRGGGLLALGESAECARQAGLVGCEAQPAPMEGMTSFTFSPDSPVARLIPDDWARASFSLQMLCRNGPQYSAVDDRSVSIVASHAATGRPCVLAAQAGAGRVVLSSVAPFGYYFGQPTFESTASPEANARPYQVFKAMLFHAAGISGDVAAEPSTPREAQGGPARGDGAAGARTVAFQVRADTLGLRGARPRNLFLMSAGEDTAQLCYDPRDQVLAFAVTTANGESVTVVRAGTAWDGRAWRHLAVTWESTSTGDAAVEIRIDGRLAATGGMPLPRSPWTAPRFGDVDGMPGLDVEIRDLADGAGQAPDWAAIGAASAAPLSFDDTDEEREGLREFQRKHKLALLAETHPGSFVPGSVHEVYGLAFDVLFEKDLLAGALEERGYAVLYAPGGGLPEVRNPMAMQDRIRAYVRGGGGYVGICAGMNEASSEWAPDRSANLFRTRTLLLPGTDLLETRWDGDHPLLRGVEPAYYAPAPAVRFMHMSGSLLKLHSVPGAMTPVAGTGLGPGLGAAGSFAYGKGRGVVWCPHPECGGGWGWWKPSERTAQVMRRLFRNSILFAAGVLR